MNEVFPQGMKIDFGDIVEALPGLVWTTQADGRSDFVNRGWREYTGLGLDEAIGYGWQTAIHPDDLTSFVESWGAIRAIRRRQGDRCAVAPLRRTIPLVRVSPFPVTGGGGGDERWCWLGLDADESATSRWTPASPA